MASLVGTCPIPASSGKTVRYRLNRGGDRRLNRALTTIDASVGTSSSGSPLCQDATGSGVVVSVVAGPGSGFSEVLVWGCELAALESESLPGCPPGPVAMCRAASLTMVR